LCGAAVKEVFGRWFQNPFSAGTEARYQWKNSSCPPVEPSQSVRYADCRANNSNRKALVARRQMPHRTALRAGGAPINGCRLMALVTPWLTRFEKLKDAAAPLRNDESRLNFSDAFRSASSLLTRWYAFSIVSTYAVSHLHALRPRRRSQLLVCTRAPPHCVSERHPPPSRLAEERLAGMGTHSATWLFAAASSASQ